MNQRLTIAEDQIGDSGFDSTGRITALSMELLPHARRVGPASGFRVREKGATPGRLEVVTAGVDFGGPRSTL